MCAWWWSQRTLLHFVLACLLWGLFGRHETMSVC